ncbi:MAG TPA: UDP-2,3-diacylglucosamine diphosphatase [Puia sp.]|nr:UDP-2,3-diacylglucosamine diphosphatase [Puia sp.]
MQKRPIDVVVLSDIHLGTFGCKAKELLNYLRSIQPGVLILNGDIIDGWQFSKRFFPSAHMQVIQEIVQFVSGGTRVFYITGNHDEMLRRFADLRVGNFTLTDKLVLEIDRQLVWIFHGDVFDNTTKGGARVIAKLGSCGYGLLILFNRFLNGILAACGQERVSISKKIMQGVNKAVAKINDLGQIATDLAIKKKYDYVICGHVHQPMKKTVESAEGKVVYLNSGDWVENMTALEYTPGEWKIFRYNAKDFPVSGTPEKRPRTTVVTGGIMVHLNP